MLGLGNFPSNIAAVDDYDELGNIGELGNVLQSFRVMIC